MVRALTIFLGALAVLSTSRTIAADTSPPTAPPADRAPEALQGAGEPAMDASPQAPGKPSESIEFKDYTVPPPMQAEPALRQGPELTQTTDAEVPSERPVASTPDTATESRD